MTWTSERVETLKKLWNEGLSASQIAAELGGVTRNAVIGKIHRLGLSGRIKPRPSSRPATQKITTPPAALGCASDGGQPKHASARKAQKPVRQCHGHRGGAREKRVPLERKAEEAVDSSNAVVATNPVTIIEARHDQCRYPLDRRNANGEMLLCGGKCAPDSSWCPGHERIVHGRGTPSEKSAIRDARRAAERDAA